MKRISYFLGFSILFTSFVSCVHVERSPQSGYSGSRPGVQAPLTNWAARSVRRNLELNLKSKEEIELYSIVAPWFMSDEEAVEFLTQPNIEQKQAWVQQKGINRRPASIPPQVQTAVETEDITMGMAQELVIKSWGEPAKREVSGNPAFRNERWKYEKYVPTPDGYKREIRTVYFEGGRVSGWTSDSLN